MSLRHPPLFSLTRSSFHSFPVRASTSLSINQCSINNPYPPASKTLTQHNCQTKRPSSTMSSDKNPSQSESDAPPSKQYLALPDASSESGITKLDVSEGSSTVKLDHMGPMVVNADGTLSRIANWGQMAEIEKQNTLRVLGKRNKQRIEALKKDADTGAGQGS